jgi:hypothetical protein
MEIDAFGEGETEGPDRVRGDRGISHGWLGMLGMLRVVLFFYLHMCVL